MESFYKFHGIDHQKLERVDMALRLIASDRGVELPEGFTALNLESARYGLTIHDIKHAIALAEQDLRLDSESTL